MGADVSVSVCSYAKRGCTTAGSDATILDGGSVVWGYEFDNGSTDVRSYPFLATTFPLMAPS